MPPRAPKKYRVVLPICRGAGVVAACVTLNRLVSWTGRERPGRLLVVPDRGHGLRESASGNAPVGRPAGWRAMVANQPRAVGGCAVRCSRSGGLPINLHGTAYLRYDV